MASRLSETSLKGSFDAGQTHLAWDLPAAQSNLLEIDLSRLTQSPESDEIIQSLPTQVLFHALKTSSENVGGLVLAAMSQDQLIRFMDYEAWSGDELDTERAALWLRKLNSIGPTKLAERFQHLDEEYQIAFLQKHIHFYVVEDQDDVPDHILSNYTAIADRAAYYLINTDSQEVGEFISELIQSMEQYHSRYAVSMLAHAAFMPPGESHATVARLRQARLEEDGFVTFHESLSAYQALDLSSLRSKWELATRSTDSERGLVAPGQGFLDLLLEQEEISVEEGFELQQRFMTLANYLCTSVKIEPSQIEELNRMFEQMRALISLGLEYVSKGDLSIARRVIVGETPKTLFRVGITLIRQVQINALNSLRKMDPELSGSWQELLAQQKHGELLWQIDRDSADVLGLEVCEILKGLFSRFPMRVVNHEGKRLKFRPVGSMSDLHDLRCSIDGLHLDAIRKH